MRDPETMFRSLEEFLDDAAATLAADPLEGRSEGRFVPLEYRGWMVRESEGHVIAYCIRVQDIGRGGASLDCVEPASVGEAVSFYLEPYRDPEHAVDAWVAGVAPGPRGRHRLRLEFQTPCPDFLLDHALRGPEARPAQTSPDACAPCASMVVDTGAMDASV